MKLRPTHFLLAAKAIDAWLGEPGNYCCVELNIVDKLLPSASEETKLFQSLFTNKHGFYGKGFSSGSTFNHSHNYDHLAADQHRVIALCFAHWVARDEVRRE